MKPQTTFRAFIASVAFVAFTLAASASFADEPKIPQTTAEHEAMAKQYKVQAAQYKKVGDEHRAMAAAYAKTYRSRSTTKS